MKKRSRKPVMKTVVEKPGRDQYEVISIPYALPLAEFGQAIQNARNRARTENRTMEMDNSHPKGVLIHIHPGPPEVEVGPQIMTPNDLVAAMFGSKIIGSRFVNEVLRRSHPWGEDAKKKLPDVVRELVKSSGLNAEKLHGLAELCEAEGKSHDCGGPCPLSEGALLIAETLKSYLKENLQ